MKQLPRDLKRDEGLARAGGEREQDACLEGGDGLQHAPDGDVLVVAPRMRTAFVFESDLCEVIPRDGILAPDAAAFHHAPARRFQRGVNVLGSGFGFVHRWRRA